MWFETAAIIPTDICVIAKLYAAELVGLQRWDDMLNIRRTLERMISE